MKRITLFLTLLMGMSLTVCAAQQVALFVNGTIDENDKFVIESRISSALSGGNYSILERTQAFLDMVTKEQAYQLSGEVSPKQQCQLGARWGAKYVIAVYAIETRGAMNATAKIINTETGQTICSVNNYKAINNMTDLVVFASTLGANLKREMNKIL